MIGWPDHEVLLNTMASLLSAYPIPVPTPPWRASNAPVVSMAMPFGELS